MTKLNQMIQQLNDMRFSETDDSGIKTPNITLPEKKKNDSAHIDNTKPENKDVEISE